MPRKGNGEKCGEPVPSFGLAPALGSISEGALSTRLRLLGLLDRYWLAGSGLRPVGYMAHFMVGSRHLSPHERRYL
jgi:hypothetical protein